MIDRLSFSRKASYFVIVLILYVCTRFDLGAALIAGLFAFLFLDQTEKILLSNRLSPKIARLSSLSLFIIIGALLTLIFVAFFNFGLSRLPFLFDRVLPRLDALASRYQIDLPLSNIEELRAVILETVKKHASSITSMSGLLTRGFFQIIVAVAIAIARFLSGPIINESKSNFDEQFFRECQDRASRFYESFDLVISAQITIAAINAGLSAIFLFAMDVPFSKMLALTTFICGMIPIVGNVVSNMLIVAAAFTRSEKLAMISLIFLVAIHKGEYFLNSRIIGSKISIPMWMVLLGLLLGEATMGITGVILAPTIIYYVREELRAISDVR